MATDWISWALLAAFVAGLAYTAWTIKREEDVFETHARFFALGTLQFPVPPWWSVKASGEDFWEFERQDTRYDWWARLEGPRASSKELHQELEAYLDQHDIHLDQKEVIIHKDQHHSKLGTDYDYLRVEGTATQKISERIYLDIVFVKEKKGSRLWAFVSHSSVLNGSVEGPYFEGAIARLEPLN